MSLPSIILNKPYILVTLANSPNLVVANGNTDLVFGFIEMVNDLCDTASVGQYCFFNINDGKAIQYGSTIYYLLDEAFVIFKEIPL